MLGVQAGRQGGGFGVEIVHREVGEGRQPRNEASRCLVFSLAVERHQQVGEDKAGDDALECAALDAQQNVLCHRTIPFVAFEEIDQRHGVE